MTNEERIKLKMCYVQKIADAKHISYQEAYKLAISQEYIDYVDKEYVDGYIDNNSR